MTQDPDTLNDMALERREQERQERELKNRILSMTPGPRKSDMWQRNFPRGEKFTGEIEDYKVY